MASRIKRELPVTVNDVLEGHVKLDLECLDRVRLHGYLGRLQVSGQLVHASASSMSSSSCMSRTSSIGRPDPCATPASSSHRSGSSCA